MSENIPESIPTSQDRQSSRPVKKARGPATAISMQSNAVEALFAKQPDIQIPSSAVARTSASLAPPPEMVANVQGSSAGAGSGEFHVYKASRRREYERIKLMEQEAKDEEDTEKWEAGKAERERRDAEKMGKNRKRREKAKARKDKPKDNVKQNSLAASGPNPMLANGTQEEAVVSNGHGHGQVDAEEANGIVIHDDD